MKGVQRKKGGGIDKSAAFCLQLLAAAAFCIVNRSTGNYVHIVQFCLSQLKFTARK